MKRMAMVVVLLGGLLPGTVAAQLQEMRQTIFGMD